MINNIEELHKKLEQLISDGYGQKPIYLEQADFNFTIDSVQKNTNPEIEPDYYIILTLEPVISERYDWNERTGTISSKDNL